MKKRNRVWKAVLRTKAGRHVLWFTIALSAASLLAVGITFPLEGRPGKHIDGEEIARLESKGIEEAPSSYFISGFIRTNGGAIINPHNVDVNQFLVLKGIDDQDSACRYYRTIGAIQESCDDLTPDVRTGFFFRPGGDGIPVGIKLDCSPLFARFPTVNCVDWKVVNGLKDPKDRVDASYFNAVDLALGRAMHGKTVTFPGLVKNTAYYVCNYGSKEGAFEDTEDNALACVAFDYSTARGFTRLYVFKPFEFEPDRRVLALAASAALDKAGEKFVPGLCKACHGSNSFHDARSRRNKFPGIGDNAKTGDIGIKFLPFDLDNFDYGAGNFSRSAQEGKFKQLNEMIPDTNHTPVVAELIKGWYAENRIQQDSQFIPDGWKVQGQLYRNVVKPFCRTCHVAMTPSVIDFATFDNFSGQSIDTFVCKPSNATTDEFRPGRTPERKMPHAAVTFDQFWLNRTAIAVLSRFLGHACLPPPP